MKQNIHEVAVLQPDYLGFIFYNKSPRFFSESLPEISPEIKKVGVFVDQTIEAIVNTIHKYKLNVIQLHGIESPTFCQNLQQITQKLNIEIWKVFSVGANFDFEQLTPYELCVEKYLFDTKGHYKGGNGTRFNWSLLERYPSNKPFIISGGISNEHAESIKTIVNTRLPVYAVDVNSKFEIQPGFKNIQALKRFKDELSS